jgi:tetratricopeptide (TPR) repeat protein
MLRSGDEALKEKRYEDAVEKFSAALEENNDNPLYLVKRAKAYIGLKEYTEALNDANRALSIDQRLADAILIKGSCCFLVVHVLDCVYCLCAFAVELLCSMWKNMSLLDLSSLTA